MDFVSTVLLGGIAGFTIFLGLPVARLKNVAKRGQTFLNSLAIGILVFLLVDVISECGESIEGALEAAKKGEANSFVLLVLLFAVGLGVGLLSLVYFDRFAARRRAAQKNAGAVTPSQIALTIAVGIGLHNFSEGLAIGQSSRSGALSLALLLIIGFGLHNATEGFGIAAPLTANNGEERPLTSWRQLALLGLIAGGPTFLGTIVGYSVVSEPISVLFLALAAGSILYVISELLVIGRKMGLPVVANWGIFLGFLVAYATDLFLKLGKV